jgi:hypothetical protein
MRNTRACIIVERLIRSRERWGASSGIKSWHFSENMSMTNDNTHEIGRELILIIRDKACQLHAATFTLQVPWWRKSFDLLHFHSLAQWRRITDGLPQTSSAAPLSLRGRGQRWMIPQWWRPLHVTCGRFVAAFVVRLMEEQHFLTKMTTVVSLRIYN